MVFLSADPPDLSRLPFDFPPSWRLTAIWGDIRVAIVVGVLVGMAVMAWDLLRGRRPGALQWLSLVLVVVSGGASLITSDPRFVMLKPTLIYLAVGAAMLQPGWMLRYVPPVGLKRVRPEQLRFWGYAWSVLMFASAGLNLALALSLEAQAWALAMSIWSPVSKLLLFLVQYAMIRGEARRAALSSGSGVPDFVSVAG